MKRRILFTLILFSVAFPYQSISRNVSDSTKSKLTNEYQIKLDTLKVQNFTKENFEKKWYENNNISWVVSLLIGITTVIASWRVTVRNNKNSREVALEQIKNAKELAITDFIATLNSKNRQDWINEVRHCLSEYLMYNRALNMEFQTNNSLAEIIVLNQKSIYNYNKLFLLLNNKVDKTEHKKLLGLIKELSALIDLQMFDSGHGNNPTRNLEEQRKRNHSILLKQEEILQVGMELLYYEWNKIQKMENS